MNKKLQLKLFAACVLLSMTSSAQAPGGVSVAAWYKTDAVNNLFTDAGSTAATNNTPVFQWNETQGKGWNLLQATAASRPVYSNAGTLANFNPTLTFDGSNDWMQFVAGTGVNLIDRADGTLYAAGYVNVLKRNGFLGFHSSMDYPGLHTYAGTTLLLYTGGPGYQGQGPIPMTAQSYFTAGAGWQNGAGTNASYAAATVSLNGSRASYNASQLQNVNLSVNARNLRIGADDDYGAFSGQLNEIMVYEDRLTTAQMDQVETYFALKYGTTYAAGTRDYKNTSGATVWSATANAGYNSNIAGIARDNNGALHQKQSWSTNAGQQVLIGSTGLANTNIANATDLTDGQYLIWADNGLAKSPTVVIGGISNISHRLAAIWKVQNTGTVGTVRVAWPKTYSNLVLIQSIDAIITSADVTTTMSGTQTINGVDYAYADVTLTNGQYFTIGVKMVAPGGITADLRVWLRSDAGFTPAQWQDLSGNLNHYTQTNSTRQPYMAAQSFNFNPIVDFGTTGSNARFMVVPAGKPYSVNGTSSSVFTVNLDRSVSGYADILGFGATTTTANLTNANLPVLTRLGANVVNYPYSDAFPALPGVAINRLYINDVSFTVGVSGIKYGQNGTMGANTQTFAASNSKHANGSILGAQPEVRNGLIGEVIAYQRDLTEAEKQRVRSYVAIKYGITLPHNYIASNGSTEFWNITTNTGYNNNIAGIARDDDGALYQKQSKSIAAATGVLIGLSTLAGSNAANAGTLTNGQSVVWGDNGLAKALSVPFSFVGVSSLNLRFPAIWKVQNTGAAGTVRVAWPAGVVNLTLVQSTDAIFDVTDTRTDMSSNIQTVNGVAYNYADVTFTNGQYFTFAGYIAGPGGVGTDLSLWYKADNGVTTNANNLVTEWATTTTNAVNLTPNGTAILPYNDQTTYTSTWNFNPTVSFDGSNNYLRNTTTAYLNAAGAVHYIVVARNPQRNTTTRSLFAIAGNDDGFFHSGVGSNTAFPTIGNNYNIASAAIATPYNYGIYSAILPKSGSPVNQRGFYNGLMKTYPSPYPYTGGAYSLPTTGAYMGADGTTGDNFNGDIAEVVLYHNATGGDMLNTDLARIHSYLALKYGITLDQTTAQNYVNSAGNVVWNAVTTNTGYNNNIAGVGRDDVGSLNQKQSKSVNAGQQVLISTTGLDNTNASNTGLLSNGQFLIWGDNNLPKAPTVALTGVADVNYRFASIWKVQNTGSIGTIRVAWPKGYASLRLIQSDDTVIDASDVVTAMRNSQIVNGIEYAYADVTLGDGKYFTFAAFVQAPGGVTNNLSYWYRADKSAEAASFGADVTSWTDFTSGTISAQLGDNALPVLAQGSSTYFNFNPGINFTAGTQALGNLSVQTVTALNFDIYTLTKEGLASGGANPRVFSSLVDNVTTSGSLRHWDGIGLNQNGTLERVNASRTQTYFANPGNINYAAANPSIMYNTFTNTTVAKGLNGAPNGTTGTHTANGPVTGGHAIGSTQFSSNGSDNAGFTGNIGELIIYGNGNNTAAERNKVESYLAVKYGITLNNTNNYTTSQNIVVWDATANNLHYHNVAGVGNDLISGLDQKQSRSQNTAPNAQVIIASGDIEVTNAANTNSLNNGQFLLWGDNATYTVMGAGATSYRQLNYGGSANSRRMLRTWKVQNTNVIREMKIRFPKTAVGTSTLALGDACASYAIIYAGDTGFTSNVTAVKLDTTEDGLNYEAIHTFPGGASYFTFGKVTPLSNTTAYLPPVTENTTVYNTNCNVGEWASYTKTDDATLKLMGLAGFTTTELNHFTVTITPEGTSYDDGTRTTRLMPRISTVTNSNTAPLSTGKVRIYYSQDEMNQTIIPGISSSNWYKYEGDADDVLTDVYSNGIPSASLATAITPNVYGIEDGVYYVEFHNINSLSSFIFLSSLETIPLPIKSLEFTARGQNGKALLEWTTIGEQNIEKFEIERSEDGSKWKEIAAVAGKSAGGKSNTKLNYSYTDEQPVNGSNYYRLKQVDLNGRYEYSPVRQLVFSRPSGVITVAPNPVSSELVVKGMAENSVITITNVMGQTMMHAVVNSGTHSIDMSGYKTGTYFISIRMENGSISNHKVIKE